MLKQLGYNYIEGSLSRLAGLIPAKTNEYKKLLADYDLPLPVCNCFFPPDITLSSPNTYSKLIKDFTHNALTRAKKLGVQICVLGSGASRSIPQDTPFNEGMKQVVQAVAMIGDIASQYGIIIAIEPQPLNRRECNNLNTVKEAAQLCRQLDNNNIKVLADLYHMNEEKEDWGILEEINGMLVHIHLSAPDGNHCRFFPAPGDIYDYSPFMSSLRINGYNKRISIEALYRDFDSEAQAAIKMLHQLFN